MRVISQHGNIDLPYEQIAVCHAMESVIALYNGNKYVLGEYSSKEKAYKAMEMLREAYVGMPMMYKAKDVAEAYKEATEKDLLMMFDSKIDNVFVVKANIFQFPQDDEIEV